MPLKNFRIHILFCIGILLLSATVFASKQVSAVSEDLSISPEVVDINAFFSGQDLTISGDIRTNEDVIIEIRGHDVKSSFDLKGRIGPFWMTKGNVTLKNVPSLYLLLLPEGTDWENKLDALELGINHLKSRMEVSSSVEMPDNLFEIFTQFEAGEGLYQQFPDAIKYSDAQDGVRHFTAKCRLPALIGVGSYAIKAAFVENGAVKREATTQHFTVRQVGFVRLVDKLASDRRILYGVSAVVIALAAGLLMGILFKQDGGSH